MHGRDIARDHYPVFINGIEVGHVTSGSPSITLKKNIGLAYLPAANTAIGTTFQVSVRGRFVKQRSCERHFISGDDMNPKGLLYTKEHEWLKISGDAGTVGITDHAQKELGEVVYVELPKVGDKFDAGKRSAQSSR